MVIGCLWVASPSSAAASRTVLAESHFSIFLFCIYGLRGKDEAVHTAVETLRTTTW